MQQIIGRCIAVQGQLSDHCIEVLKVPLDTYGQKTHKSPFSAMIP